MKLLQKADIMVRFPQNMIGQKRKKFETKK